MKDPKVIWAWVGGVIVVIAVVVAVVWHFIPHAVTPSSAGPVPVHASAGQLVAGFPQALVLDNSAQVGNSYSMNYSSSTNQYTAEWTSSSSTDAVYADYQAYAKTNSWTITNQMDSPTLKGIYATIASSSAVNIVITQDPTNAAWSSVTISYNTD